MSFYWALGGTVGLDTVGQGAVELAGSGNVAIRAALWFVGLIKVAGGLLALALIQPWGTRVCPRWMLLVAGWGGTALLVLYGGGQIGVQLLVQAGTIQAPADMDWRGFYGHLNLWNPWFLLWGVLLGITAFCYTRSSRRHYRAAAARVPAHAAVPSPARRTTSPLPDARDDGRPSIPSPPPRW